MTSLSTYPWVSATARMGITDIMWQYEIRINGDASHIPMYQLLEYNHPITNYPLVRCVPVSRVLESEHPSTYTTISGYSHGIFLKNPIHIMERQSRITLDAAGNISVYENPKDFLTRIWGHNNSGIVLVFQDIPASEVLKKQYIYDAHPITDLVSEIADDYNRVYFEKIVLVDGVPTNKFYIINFEDIDSILDLPAQITINAGDNCLIGSPGPKVDVDLTDSYNTVWVELCRKKDNAWFVATAQTQTAIAGETPRVMVYRSTSLLPDPAGATFLNSSGNVVSAPASSNCGCVTVIPGYASQSGGISMGTPSENLACQVIANNKATELLDYLELDVKRYDIELRLTRPEYYQLALYQKITFNGFTTIPSDTMRITEIEYSYNAITDGGDRVKLIVVPETEISVARQFEEMQNDIRANQISLKQSIERNVVNNKLGIVKSLSAGNTYANLQLRSSGQLVQIRAWGERAV